MSDSDELALELDGVGQLWNGSSQEAEGAGVTNVKERMQIVKAKRKVIKGKITRTINRLKDNMQTKMVKKRRILKELEELRADYTKACELHGELYEYTEEAKVAGLDKWESDLTNDIYGIEELAEDYLASLDITEHETETVSKGKGKFVKVQSGPSTSFQAAEDDDSASYKDNASQDDNTSLAGSSEGFDWWITSLKEYQETKHCLSNTPNMSLAEALIKIEASRDIPNITLPKYSGDPLEYVNFMERFKIHIHDKAHLTDAMRLVQLKMHLTGEAERAIAGLGSSGTMYATALKMLKEQFGQESYIARAYVNKLTKGNRIQGREALRDFSLDLINCIATLTRMGSFADINANDNLRQIVMRMPGYLIDRWKVKASDIRERGERPSIRHISDFIRKQVKAEFDPDFGDLERRSDSRRIKGLYSHQQMKRGPICYLCSEEHRISDCPTFTDCTVPERTQKVRDLRLCFGCLVRGHITRDCKTKKACGINGCSRTHNKMLHFDPQVASSIIDTNSILPVVRVMFKSLNGRTREGNVLIDGGAGTTIIRKEFAKSLGLQGNKERLDLSLVGCEKLENINSCRLKFWISSLESSEAFEVEAYEIDKTVLNVKPLDRNWLRSFSHLNNIELSHKAGPIDLILGVQYSHLHAEEEVRQGLPFDPIGKKSKLGWYVMGPDKTQRSVICSVNFVEKLNLDKFYQFETLGVQAPNCKCSVEVLSSEDRVALKLMKESCRKVQDRYEIGLPWKKNPALLPNNYNVAYRRLVSLEKNLLKNDQKAKMYCDAVNEYEQKEWAEKIDEPNVKTSGFPVYYLPHHGVYRPDKPSTPLRVVFDPACVCDGVSLNSYLYKGPGLIGNLLSVLLRFQEDRVAIVGDISKMYLQIRLRESDTHLHRFLWRDLEVDREPSVYRLLRVAFSDKSSPDMASYVMLRIAEENEDRYPEASAILRDDRYMDDLIHSCETPGKATKKINEVNAVLATGQFQIKKWFCSSQLVREQSRENQPQASSSVSLDGEEIKTLGIRWNPDTDNLSFAVKNLVAEKYTKRQVLSRMSMLYDPLGLALAITIKARVAMQDIWRQKSLDWDDELPKEMYDSVNTTTLHVFADASMKSYGAAAYLTCTTENETSTQLIMAKARVAPLHQTTIPRLELMAALIASRLATTIKREIRQKLSDVILWTDSQIVLHWIRAESITFKAFVGVRIAEIQSQWNQTHWRYVPTYWNPADHLSRGISVEELNGSWMYGPEFLKLPANEWPTQPCDAATTESSEEKRKCPAIAACAPINPVIEADKFSSWQRLLRVTAYCLRFVRKLKDKIHKVSQLGDNAITVSCEEMKAAELYWIKCVQRGMNDWKSDFCDLAPFEEKGIVRVGGRLRHSPLQYDQIHPVLLSPGHHVCRLIMCDVHVQMGHAGPERTLCESRRYFWIVRGRNLAKSIVRNCVVCRKLRQPGHTTLMADLPPERLLPFSPPFHVTGVDLFGPMSIKYGRNKTQKVWGAIFTCVNVRAVHLEIVDGLSTQAFLQALRRFVSNHGWPHTVISDNGTSFVGTERELRTIFIEGKQQMMDFALLHRINWKFITPLSPHQGGIYESLIKQVKRSLKVIIGQQILSWNELSTAFAEVKGLLNARPLYYTAQDPNDPQALTLNHFLLGRASINVPQGPFQETKNLHKRFEYVQMLVKQIWKRFLREYLPTLMRRSKWRTQGRQLQIGDIVLLMDNNAPRGKWDLARIVDLFPGKDGIIRNVRVRTKNGEYNRSVQKCCLILEYFT
ncbi:uncharacterized protein LOC125381119 [Haliotis rufescens]|uniref:uncharacterized protein LOC125381119 n=1 Tax=Haliotis rufescens TaxID=6454 RepID=UPI00201EAD73|nr:uncharacterized protein LOC125381119 [Haliotis rufescens]